jgi:hypothetical protein
MTGIVGRDTAFVPQQHDNKCDAHLDYSSHIDAVGYWSRPMLTLP